MIKNKFWLFLGAVFFSISSGFAGPLKDSIGIEKKGGKTYIVHKVEAKETLYSLSRRYGVTVDEIKQANADQGTDLKVGQTLLVPAKNVSTAVVHPASVKTHTVEPKETLYSISRMYDVSVDDLKKANPDVKVDDMKVGQVLVLPKNAKSATAEKKTVPAGNEQQPVTTSSPNPKTHTLQPKETLYALSRKYEVTVDDLKKANPNIDVNDLKVGQVINIPPKSAETHADVRKVTPAPKTEKKEALPPVTENRKDEKKDNKQETRGETNLPEIKKEGYTKVNESGFVEMYEANSDFHYALHRTAPIGTIIFVENEDNGQKVYVRVMGRLTDAAPGTFMKISRKAYEKIAKGEAKVKVSTSYIP